MTPLITPPRLYHLTHWTHVVTLSTLLLYHLGEDPGERFDVSGDHPEVIADILELVEQHRQTLEPQESLFDQRPPAQN